VRRKHINWIDFKGLDTTEEFYSNDFFTMLKKDFTMKMAHEPDYADIEAYV
jgi:hypothetical protein